MSLTHRIRRLFVQDLIEADGGHRTVSFQSIRQETKIARQKAWKTKGYVHGYEN